MRYLKKIILVLAFIIAGKNLYSQVIDSSSMKIIGSWIGLLDIPNKEAIRLVFIFRKENDSIISSVKSPDQSSKEFHSEVTTFRNNNLHIELKSMNVTYDGVYNSNDTSITGTFVQGSFSSTLDLKIYRLNRPQEPKPPFPYNATDVEFKNEKAGITLAGTLTTPFSGGPFPVVVLISGSGPEDRNEEVFGHKPFLVLADYLTKNGIAVLRFDDRGTGKSTGNYATSDAYDFATDVVAGIEFLKKNNKIDKSKIGLIGHSEGGIIAPMIASENPDVAFIVLMAGPGIPGDQLLLLQAEKIFKSLKIDDEVIALDRKIKIKVFKEIIKEKDSAQIAKKIINYYSKLNDADLKKLNLPRENIKFIPYQFLNPETVTLIRIDPAVYLKKVKCPVLAINGERDLQVPQKENLKAIEDALRAGGNKNYQVKELWLMNHLFQTADTGSPAEYETIEETISPIALETISDWILATLKK